MTRCAVYARYSDDMQSEHSIEDQVRICRERAEREGWQVVQVYADYAITGAVGGRPQFQQLLADARRSRFRVVLAEALDRVSRDQEHIAGFYKQMVFSGVRVETVAEGEISELHIGLKGTMSALFLKDLAQKTRRGLEGWVLAGRSAGGLTYGYRPVRGVLQANGEPERGLLEINEEQAGVVRRIFAEFAAGSSAITIARRLNDGGIAGPRGGSWSEGTIRGHARVGTGILRNPLYVGQRRWNKRAWARDPSTERRVARLNPEDRIRTAEVPELRIIDDELWEKVQARLAAAARPECSPVATRGTDKHLWHQRRGAHLLSAKVICATCGERLAAVGRDYLACLRAKRHAGCTNTGSIARSDLEARVIEGLQQGLMQPEAVGEFVRQFTAEWNRLAREVEASRKTLTAELAGVERQLANLVDALAQGAPVAALKPRMDALEARRAALQRDVAVGGGAVPIRLHEGIAEVYRAHVAALRDALARDAGPEVLEAARALIERVVVHPADGPRGPRKLELFGQFSALLRAAGALPDEGRENAASPLALASGLDLFCCSESGDAGTRNRRCQYITVPI